MEREDFIPISALQHAVYCLRQAALIHLEQAWEDNRFTAEGQVMHAVADKGGGRWARGLRRVMALPVASARLRLSGIIDVVEFRPQADGPEVPYPIEYKRGSPKLHRADEVQLCAQAICLEEMTGVPVPRGALFYGETKRRVEVPFDVGLRALTEETAQAFVEVMASGRTPPPTVLKQRCRACSLKEICRPEAVARPAKAWRSRMVAQLLEEGAAEP